MYLEKVDQFLSKNYKKGKTTYSGTVNSTGSYSAYAWYSKYGNWYYYN